MTVIAYLQDGTLPEEKHTRHRLILESKQFHLVDGVLYRENPTFPDSDSNVVPKDLHPALLKESHCGGFAGHLSEKAYDRLRCHVWWRGTKNDIHKFLSGMCLAKSGCKTFHPPLHPGGPFHRVAVDILQLPLTANGNRSIAVFMDYLSKGPEAFAIPDQTDETITKLFVEQITCILEELLSNRGFNFLSKVVQEVCQLLKVKKINTSGYHLQTNGLVEKFNSIHSSAQLQSHVLCQIETGVLICRICCTHTG